MALENMLVIDAVTHAFDSSDESRNRNRYAAGVVAGNFKWQRDLIPEPYSLDEARYFQKMSPDALCSALFAESQTDIACYHTLPMQGIFEDFSPIAAGVAIRDRYPHRVLLYGAASPMDGAAAAEDVERQVEELGISGVKLYPVDLVDGKMASYSLADEELVYPLLQKCVDLGVKVVAVHKAVPLGIAPTDPFRMGDLDHVARDFPELTFEVVHGGYAFLDEMSMQLSRFDNVYVNLEVTCQLLPRHPHKFAHILGELMMSGGGEKIFWGTGCTFSHPRPVLEAFGAFEMPEEMVEKWGYPALTREHKQAILGGNFARVHGLDVDALKRRVQADDLDQRKRERGLAEPWSAL